MVFGLNWIDLIIIGLLVLFALEALGRPLLLELIDLASLFLAGLISFRYYNIPARLIETQFLLPHGLSLVLGFMFLWFISEISFYLVVKKLLPKLPKIVIPGSRVFSVIPAVLRGLIFIAVALVMIATFPIQPIVKQSVLNSKAGSQILKYAYNLEQPIKGVFGGFANDSLTFLTIKPQTYEKVNLGFQTSQVSSDADSEKAMVDLVNKERTNKGLKALVFDEKLRDVGRLHSEDMFKRGYFSHYSPEGKSVADRVLKREIIFFVVGENLAYAPNVELAHKGLMNSEGHRANILSSDYNKIGIGVMDGGVYGKMFTQVFSD